MNEEILNLIAELKEKLQAQPEADEIDLMLDDLDDMIKYFTPQPTKKANIISGNFSMKYFDLYPDMDLRITLWRRQYPLKIKQSGSLNDQVEEILLSKGIPKEDILYLDCKIDIQLDKLELDFAFQTNDTSSQWPETDIKALSVSSYTGGYTYFNKVYLRGSKPDFNSPEIYNFHLIGFALPYNLPIGMPGAIMDYIKPSVQQNGILADMRAGAALGQNTIDIYVSMFKNLKWQSIFTPTAKYYLRNGNYVKV